MNRASWWGLGTKLPLKATTIRQKGDAAPPDPSECVLQRVEHTNKRCFATKHHKVRGTDKRIPRPPNRKLKILTLKKLVSQKHINVHITFVKITSPTGALHPPEPPLTAFKLIERVRFERAPTLVTSTSTNDTETKQSARHIIKHSIESDTRV